MSATKLTDTEIEQRLTSLAGWSNEDGKLFREFRFPDFVTAFAFMVQSAAVAEELSHHPEWCNSYSRVRVHLTTHDAGGITQNDFELATRMSALAEG